MLCKCGHELAQHAVSLSGKSGACLVEKIHSWEWCDCEKFRPATPPATSYVEDTSGAKFPKNYTFDGVNDFVFSTNVGFEDLQSLCLDLVSRLEKSNTDQNIDNFMEFRKTQSLCHGLPVWVVNVLRSFVAWQAAQQSMHPTSGSLRGLWTSFWLRVESKCRIHGQIKI